MRKLVTLVFVALALSLSASPAFAHHPAITVSSACADGLHVADIVVSQTAKTPATIDALTATVGTASYPVGGYSSPIPPQGMTGATAEIPGDVVGTLTVTASLSWPGGFAKTVSASTELDAPCTVTTTTEPSTTTSTEPPSSSTTVPGSTSVAPPTSVCDEQVPPCAHTGSNDSVPLTVWGLGLVAAGGLAAAGFRSKRRSA